MPTTKYIVNNVSGQTISEINSTIIITDTVSAATYSNLPTPNSISSGPSAPGSAVVSNPTKVDINFSDGIGTAWSFSPTGMTFPDDTIQSTAYEPKYKVYTALLNQSGTSDPVATVLENTIGNISWTYSSVGAYSAILIGAFTIGKTAVFVTSQGFNTGFGVVTSASIQNNGNQIFITTQNSGGGVNGNLQDTTIEIRVYN